MYTSLKAKLFAAAQQNAGLVYLLGGSSPLILRWYDQQLPQAAGTGFPAIVVRQISNPQVYATTGRLPTSFARMQFDCYGAQATGGGTYPADSQSTDALVQALLAFLDTFNADGITGRPQSPCRILADRDAGIALTQPMTFKRIVDVEIFWNTQAVPTPNGPVIPPQQVLETFTQSFANVTSIEIAHGLGTLSVVVQVFDTSGNVVTPQSVTVTDINDVTLAFGEPFSGTVVIIG
jgi:hypothetical protein